MVEELNLTVMIAWRICYILSCNKRYLTNRAGVSLKSRFADTFEGSCMINTFNSVVMDAWIGSTLVNVYR